MKSRSTNGSKARVLLRVAAAGFKSAKHVRASVRSFTVVVEAEIVPRSSMSILFPHSEAEYPWRAIVRIGSHMEWQWHRTRKEAEAWIDSWRNKGKPLVEILGK